MWEAEVEEMNMHWLVSHLHGWLAYGYEVLGGILIFVSSAVTETKLPAPERRKHWILFGTIAVVYIAIGIGIRYDDVQRSGEDREELKAIRKDSHDLVTSFSATFPLTVAISSDVARIKQDLESAKGKPDPRLIADLEAKADSAQELSSTLSRQLVMSIAPRVVKQLSALGGEWWDARRNFELFKGEELYKKQSAEQRTANEKKWQSQIDEVDRLYRLKAADTFANANNIREVLLSLLQPSERNDEDKREADIFTNAVRGNINQYQVQGAAGYLNELIKRVPIPP